jgi:hypothetical protein
MTAAIGVSAGAYQLSLPSGTTQVQLVTSVNRTAGIQYRTDGQYNLYTGNQSAPNVVQGLWTNPQGGYCRPGDLYDQFVTLLSGTLDQGNSALLTWNPLDITSPFFAVEGQTVHQAVLEFKIRNRRTTVVMATANVTLSLVMPA